MSCVRYEYKGVCNAALKLFKEVLETPYMKSVEFSFSADIETPAEVEYTITRAVIPIHEDKEP